MWECEEEQSLQHLNSSEVINTALASSESISWDAEASVRLSVKISGVFHNNVLMDSSNESEVAAGVCILTAVIKCS